MNGPDLSSLLDLSPLASAYWSLLRGAVMVAALIILASSIDDFVVDLIYWLGLARRGLRRLSGRGRPPKQRRLDLHPQKRIAVIVPAWRESEVIAGMIANTLNTFDYERLHIFVGVYANDPDTAAEVDRMARRFPNVSRADVPHDGPTNKADCLNWIVRTILSGPEDQADPFAVFVMHDAEDVVHPFGLKLVNWFIETAGMIQLPVLSMNRPFLALVAGHYMDEFAEFHTKDLQVRSALTGMTPSAGVATAFSRQAMVALCAETQDQPFNTDSLTEDYDVGHRLSRLGMASRFVRYVALTQRFRKTLFGGRQHRVLRRELVATREHFPDAWSTSMRQKARWMLGISYLGWRQLGWFGGAANRYFLFRDRKALITAPTGALAYLLVLQWLGWRGVSLVWPQFEPEPLVTEPWLWTVICVNAVFLVNRVLHRAWFTGRAHGLGPVWLSPFRIVVSNIISFGAFWRSMRIFIQHLATGEPIAWDKTRHTYPALKELKHRKRRLGDVLGFWRQVDEAALDRAAAAQKKAYRPFGLQLLDHGAVDQAALAEAFAELDGVGAGPLDTRGVSPVARAVLTPREAARFGAVVEAMEGGCARVALAEPLMNGEKAALEAALRRGGARRIQLRFVPLGEAAFALRHDPQTAERLQAGLSPQAAEALRRRHVRLGDVLVRRGDIDHTVLTSVLKRHWRDAVSPLGVRLVREGLITPDTLQAALKDQAAAEALPAT